MSKFQNPADYIIKMAQVPERCNPDLDLNILVETYISKLRPLIEEGISVRENKY